MNPLIIGLIIYSIIIMGVGIRAARLNRTLEDYLLADRRLTIHLTPEARAHIAREGFDPVFGARPLKRVIQQRIQNELAMRLLQGVITDGDSIHIGLKDGRIDIVQEEKKE